MRCVLGFGLIVNLGSRVSIKPNYKDILNWMAELDLQPKFVVYIAGRVEAFTEKPTDYQGIQQFVWGSEHCTADRPFESSMGLYVFKASRFPIFLSIRCAHLQFSNPAHMR